MTQKEILARVNLWQTKGIGPVSFRQMMKVFGTAERALEKMPTLTRSKKIELAQSAESILEKVQEKNQSFCFYDEVVYPERLGGLHDSPVVLFYRGNLEKLPKKNVAIVGTRNASLPAIQLTQKLAGELAQKGHGVISGMARGIDGAAHQGCLDFGGYTMAVLAGGVDEIYPLNHTRLYHAILEKNGAIVSEHIPLTKPQAGFFPSRNRIVAGLADLTLVVEAKVKSGSLITAEYAEKYGRALGAVPGFPSDPRAGAPNKLIREKKAIMIESIADIEKELLKKSEGPLFQIAEKDETFDYDEIELDATEEVLSLLSKTPVTIQSLSDHLKIQSRKIRLILLGLELDGQVKFLPFDQVIRLK